MIHQAAFESKNTKMLKGALHCHTTRSDGSGDPADVIRLHKRNGYDFMALTDHRIYNYQNFAPETDMLIIPGMEMDRNIPSPGLHCFHTVCLGSAKEDGNGFEQDQRFESGSVADQFEFQGVLDYLHQNGNMTFYCHPEWSCTPSYEFDQMKGHFAMEVFNTGCAMENDMDTDAAYWDDLLRRGIKIWGVAVDDGHPMTQHCKGWVRVNAQRNLNSVLEALKNGAFYSSCGPEIYDFYLTDDGQAVVECSPVQRVRFHNGFASTRVVRAEGDLITSASFRVPEGFSYVRASLVDDQGNIAWTNPIFL